MSAKPASAGKEYLQHDFGKNAPRINQVFIGSGYFHSAEAYQRYARAKTINVYWNKKQVAILHLQDVRRRQMFDLDAPIGYERASRRNRRKPLRIKLEIAAVYPGTEQDKVAVSEHFFSGLDVHCFAAGTSVLMSTGSEKNIEEIQPGDWVKTYEPHTQTYRYDKVINLVTAHHAELIKIQLEGRTLTVSADHPLLCSDGRWVAVAPQKSGMGYSARSLIVPLRIGQKLHGCEGKDPLTVLGWERIPYAEKAYTLVLQNGTTFIANGFVVMAESHPATHP